MFFSLISIDQVTQIIIALNSIHLSLFELYIIKKKASTLLEYRLNNPPVQKMRIKSFVLSYFTTH